MPPHTHAQANEGLTRREANAAGLLAVATMLNASPAMAGIFGDGGEAKYVEETVSAIVCRPNLVVATTGMKCRLRGRVLRTGAFLCTCARVQAPSKHQHTASAPA